MVIAILLITTINYYLFDRPVMGSVLEGVGIFGGMLIADYAFEAALRRPAGVQQQPSNAEEHDATGG